MKMLSPEDIKAVEEAEDLTSLHPVKLIYLQCAGCAKRINERQYRSLRRFQPSSEILDDDALLPLPQDLRESGLRHAGGL